ncbi:linker for activation of T-cells family member 2 isoform X3 [Phascolarctos cinereus]|uniref:Linker for activation of T-cells family member 2 isoform X3 n=1 Tax=Phascolarctos cinereus TaxID=38626 RepID=A0A6P5LRV3_PHACI|nr:linker for activation of T-cells family member 2 isoform X3 [Phascolarctos cinereus]
MSPPSDVSVSLPSFISQLAGPVEGRMFEGSDSDGDRKPADCLPSFCVSDNRESREPWASRSEGSWQVPRDEGRQSFTVARAFSIAGMVPEMAEYSTVQCPGSRKDKWLYSMAGAEDPDTPRYQNLRKGSRRESEPAYVDPVATDYYNFVQFQRQLKDDDDDTISYENILICTPVDEGKAVEESADYQNSASIEQWRQSIRGERSPEDDSSEPDYVNGEVGLMQ